jgi:putative acetyltransferase
VAERLNAAVSKTVSGVNSSDEGSNPSPSVQLEEDRTSGRRFLGAAFCVPTPAAQNEGMPSGPNTEPSTAAIELVPADPADAEAIARVFMRARRAMTYLPESAYSTEQTVDFFRGIVEEPQNLVLAAEQEGNVAGFGVFGEGRIDHLYVDPDHQGNGIGTRLLHAGQERFGHLEGWVFQKNIDALRLYERNGFEIVERTDGSRNEEHEPDVRIAWSREKPEAERAT